MSCIACVNILVTDSFQGTKLEIESVLRETCDRVLEDPSIPRTKATLRAVALQIMGEAFMAVKKEQDESTADSEYVRIETKNSRQKEGSSQSAA